MVKFLPGNPDGYSHIPTISTNFDLVSPGRRLVVGGEQLAGLAEGTRILCLSESGDHWKWSSIVRTTEDGKTVLQVEP